MSKNQSMSHSCMFYTLCYYIEHKRIIDDVHVYGKWFEAFHGSKQESKANRKKNFEKLL